MNSSDYIKIRALEGELMMYHKKQELALTVSTQELVIQKPHLNYYVKLTDIVSIVPFQTPGGRGVRLINKDEGSREIVRLNGTSGTYRLFVKQATMHSRSGLTEIGKMEFILPVAQDMMDKIGLYGGFNWSYES